MLIVEGEIRLNVSEFICCILVQDILHTIGDVARRRDDARLLKLACLRLDQQNFLY